MARWRPRWPPAFRNARASWKLVAGDDAAERLHRRERLAVARVDVADLAFRDRHERLAVDPVLPREVERVHAAAEDVGLVAGLTLGGDDAALLQRALRGPELLDDADLGVGDVADAQQPGARRQDGDDDASTTKANESSRLTGRSFRAAPRIAAVLI